MSFLLSELALSSKSFAQWFITRLELTAARVIMFADAHECFDHKSEQENSCHAGRTADRLPAYGIMHHVMHQSSLGGTHIEKAHVTF
jgi:hypothetical protein